MKRRDFLKGFAAATGTLAIAPGMALSPVEIPLGQGLIPMMSTVELFDYNNFAVNSDLFLSWAKEIFEPNNGERIFLKNGQLKSIKS